MPRPIAPQGLNVALLASIAIAAAACSTKGMYEYVHSATAVDCTKYSNPDDRARCKKETDISYEQYERDRQKTQGK